MVADESLYLGIDLGGTKIELAALSQDNECIYRQRIATPQASSADVQYVQIIESISTLISQFEQSKKCTFPLGIGIPGAIDRHTGLVKNANTTCLIGKPFQQDLEYALSRPVFMDNDANCFALSETLLGAGKGCNSVFAVILGTGVGGGWVINGKVHKGLNNITGEWGHNSLPWLDDRDQPQQACYCGKSGCIETYLSGPGMARQAQRQYGVSKTSSEWLDTTSESTRVYADYTNRLAKGLAHVINILDPDMIVLGGGLSNVETLYRDVPQIWSDYIFSAGDKSTLSTPLRQHVLGDSSGVFGAALLAKNIRAIG
ncbi:ROK family protein [Bermanella sp. R86510]|uniref:ROK family protein n=1 Tax=unclassified Bermanella TaxID=2627862 RepID=UPI0037C8C390